MSQKFYKGKKRLLKLHQKTWKLHSRNRVNSRGHGDKLTLVDSQPLLNYSNHFDHFNHFFNMLQNLILIAQNTVKMDLFSFRFNFQLLLFR